MSNQAVSGAGNNHFSWSFGDPVGRAGWRHRGQDGDFQESSSASRSGGGNSLFTALLQALTQAAGIQTASTGTPSAGTGGDATAGGTSTTAATGSAGTSQSSLAQDLHAFLHDLFRALRQASEQPLAAAGSSSATTTSSTAPVTTSTPPAATTAPTPTTDPTPTSTSTSGTTSTSAASPGASQYGQQGIITALKDLLTDLTNSQLLGTTPGTSGSSLSASEVSRLNSAFTKLISDLQPAGTTTSATGNAGTTALQAFLSSFLQDLQNGGGSATSAVGGGVNTTA